MEHSVHHVQSPQQRHNLMAADGASTVFVLADLLALSGIMYGMIFALSVTNLGVVDCLHQFTTLLSMDNQIGLWNWRQSRIFWLLLSNCMLPMCHYTTFEWSCITGPKNYFSNFWSVASGKKRLFCFGWSMWFSLHLFDLQMRDGKCIQPAFWGAVLVRLMFKFLSGMRSAHFVNGLLTSVVDISSNILYYHLIPT